MFGILLIFVSVVAFVAWLCEDPKKKKKSLAERTADAAERTADAAERSAKAAERTADAAKKRWVDDSMRTPDEMSAIVAQRKAKEAQRSRDKAQSAFKFLRRIDSAKKSADDAKQSP